MKCRLVSIGLALTAVALLIGDAWAGPNLLTNGDFETGTFAPWSSAGALQAGSAYSGNYGLHVTAGSSQITQGWVTVTPGKTYVAICRFKWNAFALTGSDWGIDRLLITNNSWVDIAVANNLHSIYQQGVWNKLAVTFVANTNGVQITAGVFGPATTVDISYDDFILMEKTSNLPPTLSPSAAPNTGDAPLVVNFTANADDPDGAVANYSWDFGDGTSETIPNPSHTYMTKGAYTVTLSVWDNEGMKSSQSIPVTIVNDALPNVSITGPTNQNTYTTSASQITLSGSAIAPASRLISSIAWDEINTDIADIISITSAATVNWSAPSIKLKPGRNEILMTAIDSQGYSGTDSIVITRTVSGPVVSNVSLTPASLREFEKVEVKFDLDSVADVPFFKYDPAPPAGLPSGTGVTVEGVFTSPSGKTLRQPGFWYRDVTRTGSYPNATYSETGQEHWMVRISPQETGSYSVTIHVQDASGSVDISAPGFSALAPVKKGFVKVSASDPRYFEFTNGDLYWPVGPITGFTPTSGMNFTRPWMAGEGAYSTNWARWINTAFNLGNEGFDSPLDFRQHYPSHELSRDLFMPSGKRIWFGWMDDAYKAKFKANTDYLVKLRVKTVGIVGPVTNGIPYGLMVKTHDWPSATVESDLRPYPSLTPIISRDSDWHTVVARYHTGTREASNGYLAIFFDNVSAGNAYVDQLSIREILSDGSPGGEQIRQSKGDMHTYVDQRPAAHFDDEVAYFEQNGIYSKYVIQDKRDWIPNHITAGGAWADTGDGYYQTDGTKAKWLQQQWWRYLIARWGYSTAIHSWELNNEGSPTDKTHWRQTQDLAKFMHQNDIHRHLASTSFWCCWEPQFWNDKTNYPDVDYGDIHTYALDAPSSADMAAWHLADAAPIFASNVGRPVIRGETGINYTTDSDLLKNNSNPGYWLHDLLWCELYPGAMFDPNYWYSEHLNKITGGPATVTQPFAQFLQGMDLNKGGYVDAAAGTTNTNIRVVGQKNLPKGEAQLWIQNKNHTWVNAMQSPGSIGTQTGTVTVRMSPSTSYNLEWWNTYTAAKNNQTLSSNSSGDLLLSISSLADDTAVKITPTNQPAFMPPAAPRNFRFR